MVEESKYCTDIMKKYFDKGLVMVKEDDEYLGDSSKCWICDNVDGAVKVRSHCHITRKYKDSAHRGCNINVKSQNYHSIP